MRQSKPELYEKIIKFEIDDPTAVQPFSRRLAKQNDLSIRKVHAAIAEYKKYIYLVCISARPVTPSQTVDDVWHLHLTYTKNYWDEFCGQTLNRPIHHLPSNGRQNEHAKHVSQYQYTLDLYVKEFGERPPNDFWPEPKSKDRESSLRGKLNSFRMALNPKYIGLTLFGLLVLAGCTVDDTIALFESDEWFFWLLFGGAIVLILITWSKDGKGGGGAGCTSGQCNSDCGSSCGGGD